jgi:glyoxylase-like metal-dependent hydrolase (beta-lactamase superfamily II)
MPAEVHRYKVGDIEVTVLSDGFRMVPVDGKYLSNATADDLQKALAAAGLPVDKMKNTYSPIVLTTGGKRVLFDTGNGENQVGPSKGERGTLNQNLHAAGIDRNAIDVVVISHFHADHVNGLLDVANKPAFPNAEIKVPENEWKFWMDDGEMSRASPGRMTELFANNRRVFDALGRKVTPYAWDKEVVPGVTAVGTPGHSRPHLLCCVVRPQNAVRAVRRLQQRRGVRAVSGLARLLRPGSAAGRGDAQARVRHAGGRQVAGAGLSLPVPGVGADREDGAGLSRRGDGCALKRGTAAGASRLMRQE